MAKHREKSQYEAGYFESSTGLVKFGTRYYNPNLGRWTQQDPLAGSLGKPDTLNRYLYVDDDPVNQVDSSGKDIFECALAIALLIVGIIGGVTAIIAAILTGGWIIVVYLLIVAGGSVIIIAEIGFLLALLQGVCS